MGQINLPSLDDITQIKDPKQQMEALLNTVGLLMKSLTEINGYLNSKNIFEAGGWRVTNTELVSKDGDVGMSTEDIGLDDVRFWAGGTVKDTALWRVHKSGQGVATGWRVQSKDGAYPLIVLDPNDDLLGAYSSATNFISVRASDPSISGFSPSLNFENGIGHVTMYMDSGGALEVLSSDGIGLDGGAIGIYLSGTVRIVGGFGSLSNGTTNLQAILNDLQAQINTKSAIGHTHSVTTADHNHGNPANAPGTGGGTFTTSS